MKLMTIIRTHTPPPLKPKRLLLCLTLLFSIGISQAQNRGHYKKEYQQKIKAYRVSYFTEELDLTVEEAEKFWPLYRQYDKRKDSLHRSYSHRHKTLRDSLSEVTEEQALQLLKQQQQKETLLLQQKKEQIEAFTRIIGPKKTFKLMHLEHRFRQRLIEKIRKKEKEHQE